MPQAAPRVLLEAALAAWRRTGLSHDAWKLNTQADEALAGWTPPTASSERAFQRAWLRAVCDPIGRAWALATLLDQLPGPDPIHRACALAKRIEVLARHAPDPRFERAVAMVRASDVAVPMPRLWNALARLKDAALPHTITSIAVVTQLPEATPEIAALWRAVEERSDDDGTLAVLSDALQSIGDPRGELIALQLTGGDDPTRLERQRLLVASCGAAWLGRLAAVTEAATFERGILRRLQLARGRPVADQIWNTVLADPRLATVTDLIGNGVDTDIYARFVTSPSLRSLARIDVVDRRTLAALENAPPTLAHVTYSFTMADEDSLLEPLIGALGRRPGVTSIAIAEPAFEQVAEAPWFGRLSAVTLGISSHIRRGLARWPALGPAMQLVLVHDHRLPACTTTFPWDFGITLSRERDGTVAQISGEWLLLPLDVLTALPPDVVRIDVDHRSAHMAERIRNAVNRPAVSVVHRPIERRTAVFLPSQRDQSASARRA